MLRYRLDGVVTLVDAVYGHSTLDQHPEAVKQAAVADRLVLSKTDLLEGPQEAEAKRQLIERLRVLNPAAPILDAAAGQATASRLLDCGLYDPDHKIADVQRWLAEEAYADAPAHAHGDHAHDRNRHDDHIRAFALTAEEPIPAPAFDMFLDLVRSLHGPNLLRVKGIVNIADAPERPMVDPARVSSTGIASRLAGRGPPHAAGVHHPGHRGADHPQPFRRVSQHRASRSARPCRPPR